MRRRVPRDAQAGGKTLRVQQPALGVASAPDSARAYHYRSAAGAEVALVLEFSASRRWALEFKKSSAPHVEKGFHVASDDLGAERRILVYPGSKAWPAGGGVEVMPLLGAIQAARAG